MKKLFSCLIVAVMISFVTACGEVEGSQELMVAEAGFEELESLIVEEGMDTVRGILVHGSNGLGLEVLKDMADSEEGNILISPVSLSMALAMLQNGAGSTTLEQMLSVMGEDADGINERYNIFQNHMNLVDKEGEQ